MTPLHLLISPPRRLRGWVAAAHAVALAACMLALHHHAWLVISAALGLLVSAAYYDHTLHHPAITGVEVDLDHCRIKYHGQWLDASVREALVTQPLTIIRFYCQGKTVPLVLLDGHLAQDDYRRFRVWLRWGQPQPAAAVQSDAAF